MVVEAVIDLEKLIPKDSIRGNETICPMKRVTLKTILTKRFQFVHMGDSPPTSDLPLTPAAAVEDQVMAEGDAGEA